MSNIRETTNNSISLNPKAEEIVFRYKDTLDWLLYELAEISDRDSEYTYNTPIGRITINCK